MHAHAVQSLVHARCSSFLVEMRENVDIEYAHVRDRDAATFCHGAMEVLVEANMRTERSG